MKTYKWKELSEDNIKKIIYNYTELKNKLSEAGKEFNLNGSEIRNLLSYYGVKQRKNARDTRKYKVNDNYFDIQGPNMAYILGFWAADGNVHSNENRLDLELASVDLEILEKIKEEIQSERPIKIYECQNGYAKNKLYFWSQKIKEIFSEYGVVPNKTYSKDFHAPYKLDKKYWIDYIRGFFDGDGCVKKTNSLTFELNSVNKKFLIEIQSFFKEYYNIDLELTTAGTKGRNIPLYRLYCYGEKSYQIFKILYTPNSLFLKRKHDKWIELM